jgi:ATP-dependent RNA helicase DDX55/SPB4
LQTCSIVKRFVKHSGAQLTVLSLVGGGGHEQLIEHDIAAFHENGGNVIVATPGRLNEFLTRLPRACARVDVLVLDEADRLLDARFAVTVDEILSRIPKGNRRTVSVMHERECVT